MAPGRGILHGCQVQDFHGLDHAKTQFAMVTAQELEYQYCQHFQVVQMSSEFRSFKKGAEGRFVPVVLVGENGFNKEQKFLESVGIKSSDQASWVVREDFSDFAKSIKSFTKNIPGYKNVDEKDTDQEMDWVPLSVVRECLLTGAYDEVKNDSSAVIVFENIDKYESINLSTLLEFMGREPTASKVIFSCERVPDMLTIYRQALPHMQIVEMTIHDKFPSLSTQESSENLEINMYGNIANLMVSGYTKFERGISKLSLDEFNEDINSKAAVLLSFVTALEGVDGGAFGKKAFERGMNVTVATALIDFNRKFKDTSIESIQPIIKILGPMVAAYEPTLFFIEKKAPARNHEPDEPSLG